MSVMTEFLGSQHCGSLCSFNERLYTYCACEYFWAISPVIMFVNIEIQTLRKHLAEYSVHKYEPTLNIISEYKDGGVAIVDQWICAHAR